MKRPCFAVLLLAVTVLGARAGEVGADSPPNCQTFYSNGQPWKCCTTETLGVCLLALADKKHLYSVDVLLVNASEGSFTFAPKSIVLYQVDEKWERTVAFTYSEAEWDKKLRRSERFARITTGLQAAGAAMSNNPQPQTSTVSAYSSDGRYAYGTVVTQPSTSDRVLSQMEKDRKINEAHDQLATALQQLSVASEETLRTNTLAPFSYVRGKVHFEDRRAKMWLGSRIIEVPFGGTVFEFIY